MEFPDEELESLLGEDSGFFDVGETIGSDYEVLEFIKEGADAEVYRVRNKVDNREFAAKVPKDGNSSSQFEQESKLYKMLAGRQDSEHLVKIYPSIEHKGCPVFIMEFLRGRSLQNIIDSPEPKTARRINQIIKDILRGLEVLHQSGIVHCDVTPNNVILTKRGAVLIDLSASVTANEITEQTARRGTDGYMPPDDIPTFAWDIYSVGVIYYQLLLGNRPAWTRDPKGTEKTSRALTMPDSFGHYLGSRPILEKALSLNPESRYQSASEMLSEVKNPLHSERIGSGIKIFRKRHPVSFVVAIAAILVIPLLYFQSRSDISNQLSELQSEFGLNLTYMSELLDELPQTSEVKVMRTKISDLTAEKRSGDNLVFILESAHLIGPKEKFDEFTLSMNINQLAGGRDKTIEISLDWQPEYNRFSKTVEPGDEFAFGISDLSGVEIHLEGIVPWWFNPKTELPRIDFEKIQPQPDGLLNLNVRDLSYQLRVKGFYFISED